MFKKLILLVFVSLVSVASLNALAEVDVGSVRINAATQHVKLALNDIEELIEPASQQAALRQSANPKQDVLATMWILGAALSLFVMRASRLKV